MGTPRVDHVSAAPPGVFARDGTGARAARVQGTGGTTAVSTEILVKVLGEGKLTYRNPIEIP